MPYRVICLLCGHNIFARDYDVLSYLTKQHFADAHKKGVYLPKAKPHYRLVSFSQKGMGVPTRQYKIVSEDEFSEWQDLEIQKFLSKDPQTGVNPLDIREEKRRKELYQEYAEAPYLLMYLNELQYTLIGRDWKLLGKPPRELIMKQ